MRVDSAPKRDSTGIIVDYRDPDGIHHVKHRKMVPDPETGYLDFNLLEDQRPTLTFRALAEEWLDIYPVLRGLSPNTVENRASTVRAHLIPYFADTPVHTIGPEAIEGFIVAKRVPLANRARATGAKDRSFAGSPIHRSGKCS